MVLDADGSDHIIQRIDFGRKLQSNGFGRPGIEIGFPQIIGIFRKSPGIFIGELIAISDFYPQFLQFRTVIGSIELTSLKWTDIQDYVMNLQRRESRGRAFDEKGEPGEYTFDVLPGLKKRKVLRAIPITSRMESIFSKIRECAPTSEYVFVRRNGKRITEKAFSDRLKVLCRLAGVPERSIHKLRFSYISRTVKSMPTKVLTELTGSTVRMINYYNKNTAEIQEIRDMMERAECL